MNYINSVGRNISTSEKTKDYKDLKARTSFESPEVCAGHEGPKSYIDHKGFESRTSYKAFEGCVGYKISKKCASHKNFPS